MSFGKATTSIDVAAVVIAHDKPQHLHRLVAALAPLPVYLHVDARTPSAIHAAMVDSLPGDRVTLLPRRAAGWARPELVHAELDGCRAALAATSAEHFVIATGADYPLVSMDILRARLAEARGTTLAHLFRVPYRWWGVLGGLDRFLVPQEPRGRARRIVGPPRRFPRGIRPAGGSQTKVLARDHLIRILEVLEDDARVGRYLDSCWIPDEVAIPTLLASPRTGIDWRHEIAMDVPWYVDWGLGRRQSPRVLQTTDFPEIADAADLGALFARKFDDASGPLLDLIDAELRR